MAWREVIVESNSKISCSNNYLIVRNEDTQKIHLSEISYLMIANPSVNITGVALCELAKYKIKVVFCDEKHNPYAELTSYYGCHNCSKKVLMQINWQKEIKSLVNTQLLYAKIYNQASLIQKLGDDDRAQMIYGFLNDLQLDDSTNREGHSAKVYFNTLFGIEFNRNLACEVNSALNYGYSIILSAINREIVANGCLTQLGINHKNEYNQFNLSCDIMEPFRIIVDEFVVQQKDRKFDTDYKHDLVDLLNKKIMFDGSSTTILFALATSVKSVIDALNTNNLKCLKTFYYNDRGMI